MASIKHSVGAMDNQNITSTGRMINPGMDADAFLRILMMPHIFSGKNRISSWIVELLAGPE
jgi:hypothetical protein